MQSLKGYIQKLDILVKPYEFKIKEGKNVSTLAGGLISIIIFGFTAYYFILQFANNQQQQKTLVLGSDSSIQLNLATLEFGVSIKERNSSINLENLKNYFKVGAQIVDSRGFILQVELDTVCSPKLVKLITIPPQSQLICFNTTNLKQLKGEFGTFQQITIEIQPIQTETQVNYEQYLLSQARFDIQLLVLDNLPKSELDLENPTEQIVHQISTNIQVNAQEIQNIEIAPFWIDIQYNEIFRSYFQKQNKVNIFNGISLQNKQKYYLYNRPSGITINFQSSPRGVYQYTIESELFGILLASISESSGLAIALISVAKLFYTIYSQHKMFEIMMNYVFKFDLDETTRKNSLLFYQNRNIEESMNPKMVRRRNHGDTLEHLFKFNIKYNFCNYLSYNVQKFFKKILKLKVSCLKQCFTTDERIVTISQIAKSKIETDLDLTNIIKKLYEIDCIKLFLFDEEQLQLFNSFCSPVFQYDQIVQSNNILEEYKQQQQQQQQIKPEPDQVVKNQLELTFAMQSKIPINLKLTKVARFFKAQMEAKDGQDLIDIYKKLRNNENPNAEQNQRLQQFASYNETLFRLVHQCSMIQRIDTDDQGTPQQFQTRLNEINRQTKLRSTSKSFHIPTPNIGDEGRMYSD